MEHKSELFATNFTSLQSHAAPYPLKSHFFSQNITYLKHLEQLVNKANQIDLQSFHSFKDQVHSLLESELNKIFKEKLDFAQRGIAESLEMIRRTHQKVLFFLQEKQEDLTPSELIKMTQQIALLVDRASSDQNVLSQAKLELHFPLKANEISNLFSSLTQVLFEINPQKETNPLRKGKDILIQPLPSTSDILFYNNEQKIYLKKKKIEYTFPESRFGALNLSDCAIIAGGKINSNLFTPKVLKLLASGEVIQLSPLRKAKCSFPLVSLRVESLLFSLGGYNGIDLSEVEMYSRIKDQWYQMPSLMHAKCAQAGCNLESNHVFVFAGNNLGQELNQVERFNLSNLFEGWKLMRLGFQIKGNFMSAVSFGPSHILIWGFEKSFEIQFETQENQVVEVNSITFKRGFEHSCEGGATYKLISRENEEEGSESILVSFTTDLESIYHYREHEWVS